jgi:purine nucleosidase
MENVTKQEGSMVEPVIFDTDIGTDIDDAYALALLLNCPELELLGVTIGHGSTRDRARIALKMLHLAGRNEVRVAAGSESEAAVNQAAWAESFDLLDVISQPAGEFIVESIAERPGEITVIAVGPFTNLADAIRLDAEIMHKAKRVIIMGGCMGLPAGATPQPYPEYNAKTDAVATKMFLGSSESITLVPLDVTRSVPLPDRNRRLLAQADDPLCAALTELYEYWPGETPLLHDPLAVAMAVSPRFCGTQQMRVSVGEDGSTITDDGGTPMSVCATVEVDAFLNFFMSRLLTG